MIRRKKIDFGFNKLAHSEGTPVFPKPPRLPSLHCDTESYPRSAHSARPQT